MEEEMIRLALLLKSWNLLEEVPKDVYTFGQILTFNQNFLRIL